MYKVIIVTTFFHAVMAVADCVETVEDLHGSRKLFEVAKARSQISWPESRWIFLESELRVIKINLPGIVTKSDRAERKKVYDDVFKRLSSMPKTKRADITRILRSFFIAILGKESETPQPKEWLKKKRANFRLLAGSLRQHAPWAEPALCADLPVEWIELRRSQ